WRAYMRSAWFHVGRSWKSATKAASSGGSVGQGTRCWGGRHKGASNDADVMSNRDGWLPPRYGCWVRIPSSWSNVDAKRRLPSASAPVSLVLYIRRTKSASKG